MASKHPPNFIHALAATTQHPALAPEIPAYLGFEPGAILSLAHPGFRGDEAMLGGCATRGCVEMTRLRLLSCNAFT
jgi:hypothetical protein